MKRVNIIEHSGKKILHLDFSASNNSDELIEAVKIAKAVINKNPLKSLLCLTDIADSLLTAELVGSLYDLAKSNKPYVKASAILGISKKKKCLLNSLLQYSGREIEAFEEIHSAKEWLISK
jgi:hypothetical protein